MKTAIAFLFLIFAVIAVSALFRSSEKPDAALLAGLPWQIDVLADGSSRVFGLTLAHSTLDDARAQFGADVQIAVIAAPGEPGSLEVYYNNVTAGVIMGKMILAAAVDRETVARLRQRAAKTEYMDSSTKKFILRHADLALAWRAPIAGITFIPVANLDEATVLSRFGVPAERIRVDARAEHFLYPQKGLDLILDSQGKEVLQYVAPREFARLRAPLIVAAPAKSRGP